MAVLVTGGAGYIGSIAVEKLLAAGEEVVVCDNLSTGHRAALSPQAMVYEGNILDLDLLRDVFFRHPIDTVMHFAAFIVVSESCEDPAKYFENNVAGALNVLRAMREYGVNRFIFSSTAAVYGHPEHVPIPETAPIRPLNPYGISKRMVEQVLEWYDRAYGMRYAILRYFNAAGASATFGEDHYPETHLIPNVLRTAEGLQDVVTVYGRDYKTPDGTCLRDYIHVEDLIDAHIRAMNRLRHGKGSDVFNLGNSIGISVLDVIHAVERVTGYEVAIDIAPRRAGDADRLIASSEKARDVLGWKPVKSDIDTIVEDAWNWMQAHPDGYPN